MAPSAGGTANYPSKFELIQVRIQNDGWHNPCLQWIARSLIARSVISMEGTIRVL